MLNKQRISVVLAVAIVFGLGGGFLHAKKVAEFDEILKADFIYADSDRIYVNQKFEYFIYSLKDYKLIKKFGKQGEGPREFNRFVRLAVMPKEILINSQGKVSFYTKDGEFIKELKPQTILWLFKPMGKHFVSYGFAVEKQIAYRTINLLDGDMKKVKELARYKRPVQREGKIDVVATQRRPFFYTTEDKVFVQSAKDGVIDVYDVKGILLYSITPDLPKVEFTKAIEKECREFLAQDPRTKGQYDALINRLKFPEYFPLIKHYVLADNKIYVITSKKTGNIYECLVLDLKGKLLKRSKVPIVNQSPLEGFPYDIRNGKLYQLVENIDEETTELHVTDI